MRFYIAAIDSSGEDFLSLGQNYVSTFVADLYNADLEFDYNATEIDELVGMYYVFNDNHARGVAIQKILYDGFGLRAIRLIMEAKKLQNDCSMLRDLSCIRRKLISLGLGYISEKTYLLPHLAQYRLLLRDYVNTIHTITLTEQIYNFIITELFGGVVPDWIQIDDISNYLSSSSSSDDLFDDIYEDLEEHVDISYERVI